MKVPFNDLRLQYHSIKVEIDEAINEVLETSAFTLGAAVERFEQEFAQYCNAKYCVGVNSGTAALTLLLQAHDIGFGDEVITAANTFFATAEAISLVGAAPVLVDCEEETALIDPKKVKAAITSRTKAIIPVHLYGQVADMDIINAIAKTHGFLVFEDACQAHGARYRGKIAGSLGDGAAFSFYPGKNLGAYGEAGAVVISNSTIAKKVRMLRNHGSPNKNCHENIGWNERMDGIQGAVLQVKLRHLDTWNADRRRFAEKYKQALKSVKDVGLFEALGDRSHVHHLFVIRVDERDTLNMCLAGQGIQTGIHYPIPIHLQPAYKDLGWQEGDFPVAERLSKEILSLPLFPLMTDGQLNIVCDAVSSFFMRMNKWKKVWFHRTSKMRKQTKSVLR